MKNSMKMMAVGAAVLSVASMASAEIININLMSGGRGSSVGTAYFMNGSSASMPAAYTGTTWNDSEWGAATQTSMTDLLDTDGNATGVGLTLSGGSNYGGDAMGLEVLKEYRYFGAGGITIDLSGLGANAQWDVYCLSQGNADGRTTQFVMGGATNNAAPADLTALTWTDGGNYVKFASATADASGNISITATSLSGNNNGSLNGIQLVAIPEPATIGLIGLSGLGLIMVRRFRV